MKYKTIQEIETRKAAILKEMEQDGADLEALKKEMDELRQNAEEIKTAAAKAEELRKAIALGASGVVVLEKHDAEGKPASLDEVRNSPEYIEAYANYIKTGRDAECRTVLLSKNAPSPASGQLPVPDMLESIIKTAWEKNEFLNRIRKTYFRGNLRVPFELSATGAWVHAEGTTGLTEEEITIGIVELKPENIKKWIRISDEAIDMGGEDFLRYIYDEITYRILMELVKQLIADVTGASASNSSSAIGVPVVKIAPGVNVIRDAVTKLTEEATDICVVLNRQTEASFNAAYAIGNFPIDPFDGLPRVYTSALPVYSAASENDTYAIIGDLKALQANYPVGEGVVIKWDDLSLAEDDLVKVVGRQYAGHGITAHGRLVKLTKPAG
ncbi:MAG: phage major capsid protein [Clostridia bacterium]|nr:phage major capsid protein [Clostridia bacterium]